MGLMKELSDLNAIYHKMTSEGYEETKTKEVISALDKEKPGKRKKPLSSADKKKIANKVVTSKGDTSKSDDRYAYEDTSPVDHYLDELKKSTLGSYVKKASQDLSDRRFDQGRSEKATYEPDEDDDKEEDKLKKREKGIKSAADKLTKEEIELVTKLVESGLFSEEELKSITEISSGKLLDAARASEVARGKKAVAGDRAGAAKEVKRSSKFFNAALGKVKSKEQQMKTKSEGYQRDPEKGEAEAKKADKRSAKQKRMDSPDKGINSPAFKEFMRSRGM